MKLSVFTIAGGAVISVLIAGLAAFNVTSGQAVQAHMSDRIGAIVTHMAEARDLTHLVDQVKYDVVEVQQWMTDISATRGLNGLDDGLDKAAEFAAKFKTDIAAANDLATRLGADALVASLGKIATAFEPFYSQGQTMAKAYVSGGPEAGNALMPAFDDRAAAMAESIDAMDAAADAAEKASDAAAEAAENLEQKAEEMKEEMDDGKKDDVGGDS